MKSMRDVIRVNLSTSLREQETTASSTWWIERTLPPQLPPIKNFGRKRDHKSPHGWGHWNEGKFVPLGIQDFTDGNPTKMFTDKLRMNFYDVRRLHRFREAQQEKPTIRREILDDGGSATPLPEPATKLPQIKAP